MALSGHAPPALVVGIAVALTILATCAILSRLFTRRVIVHNLGWDDGFATGALLLSLGVTLITIVQAQGGVGLHENAMSEQHQVATLKPIWASFAVFNMAMALAQESILIQFLRIFPHGMYRNACYCLMLVVLIQGTWSFWTSVFLCSPVSYFWEQPLHSTSGQCLNETTVWCVTAAVNTIIYLAMGVMPVPVLQALDMPRSQKYALMLVFCLPGLTCIFSILRLEFLYLLSISNDFLYDAPMTAIWTTTELNFAILASCTPTLKACLGRIFPRIAMTFHMSQPKEFDPSTTFAQGRSDSRHALLNAPEPIHLRRKATNSSTSRFGTERISIDILARELAGVSVPAPPSPLSMTTAQSSPLLPQFSPSSSQTDLRTRVDGGGPLTLTIPPPSAGHESYYSSNPTTPLSATSPEGRIHVTTTLEQSVADDHRQSYRQSSSDAAVRRSSVRYSASQWIRDNLVMPNLPAPRRADTVV